MKTLEELKQELDDARTAWTAACDAANAYAWAACDAVQHLAIPYFSN